MMTTTSSPHVTAPASVRTIMLTVTVALLPAIAAYVYFFGPAILVALALTTLSAIAGEALVLRLRGKPLAPALGDGSALLTAWLIALCFPPTSPWWLLVFGTLFAILIGKHLYGGLGQNPFNPAMLGFAASIVSFPALMSQWPTMSTGADFSTQLGWIFGTLPRLDALTTATPLDHLKTGLQLAAGQTGVDQLLADSTVYGAVAGRGWEWVGAGYLVGGLFLLYRRIISWHLPLAFLAGISGLAAILWSWQPAAFVSPLFHLFAGSTLIGAFFIVTDPVSGATTFRGKLIYGAGIGILTYLIRVFGGYPDGLAFAVLLMNLTVPLIDMLTQPPVFGAGRRS